MTPEQEALLREADMIVNGYDRPSVQSLVRDLARELRAALANGRYAAGFRAGQEAMRERAAVHVRDNFGWSQAKACVIAIRALPIVERDADK